MAPKIKEYCLRIIPPSPVLEEVVDFKQQFRTVFGNHQFAKSKPHITIATFKMNLEYQDILIRNLAQLSKSDSFELDVEGFDIFDNNSNTLHLKVSNSRGIKCIHRNFMIIWIRDLHRKRTSLMVSDTPHITISQTDGKTMLYESLELFQKLGYSRKIKINQLTLVSRYEGKTWDWEHRIELSKRKR